MQGQSLVVTQRKSFCIGKQKETSDPLNEILEAASQLNLSIGLKDF